MSSQSQPDSPKQETMEFEEEFLVSDGIKFESTGVLFVPTAGEAQKIAAREQDAWMEEHASGVIASVLTRTRQHVKMSGMDMLKLKARS